MSHRRPFRGDTGAKGVAENVKRPTSRWGAQRGDQGTNLIAAQLEGVIALASRRPAN